MLDIKKFCRLFLCCALVLQSATRAEAGEPAIPREVTDADKSKVVWLKRKIIEENAFAQYLLKRSAKNLLKNKESAQFTARINRMFSVLPGLGMNMAYSTAINGLQSTFLGALSIGAIAIQQGCEQRNLRAIDDCTDPSVIGENFSLFSEYMLSSGDFYSGMASGAVPGIASNFILKSTIDYLVKDPVGISFTKKMVMAGALSSIAYLGFSFGAQLWKMSQLNLSHEEKKRATALLGRKLKRSAQGAVGSARELTDEQKKENELDDELFKKISNNMNEILFYDADLRDLLMFNWWRFEIATGQGVLASVSMTPMMYQVVRMAQAAAPAVRAANAGKKVAGARGFVIMMALGAGGGLLAALLPEEYTHQATTFFQKLRSQGPQMQLHPNESYLRNAMRRYYDSFMIQEAAGIKEKVRMGSRNVFSYDAKVEASYVDEIKKLLEQRRKMREAYASITYEKVHDASQQVFFRMQNALVAKAVLPDVELRDGLIHALAVDEDGRFNYVDNCNKNFLYIFPSINRCSVKAGDHQRKVMEDSNVRIKELKRFILDETDKLSAIYKKDYIMLQELAERYKEMASVDALEALLDERDRLNELMINNENVMFAMLDMDKVHVPVQNIYQLNLRETMGLEHKQKAELPAAVEQDEKNKLHMAYLASSETIMTMMRDYTYFEELMLTNAKYK